MGLKQLLMCRVQETGVSSWSRRALIEGALLLTAAFSSVLTECGSELVSSVAGTLFSLYVYSCCMCNYAMACRRVTGDLHVRFLASQRWHV